MNESKPGHVAEDWGVVLQSIPSKNKREITKRLEEIFEIDKRDAEQILSNMPLILVDNLSFGLAARIKKFFLTIGAVAETTNHDMIKKNCFQVLWPQTPDLSFFIKQEMGSAEASAQAKKGKAVPSGMPLSEKKPENKEINPEMPKLHEAPAYPKPLQEPPASVSLSPKAPGMPLRETPGPVSKPLPVFEANPPVREEKPSIPAAKPPVFEAKPPVREEKPSMPAAKPPVVEEKPYVIEEKRSTASPSNVDLDWERRANELNEKLRKFHEEKQELHAQHKEAAEKVKNEYQERLEEEKKKSSEIAKAYEDLQKEAQKQEALTREGEQWRARAVSLSEKVRELETNLMQKTSAVEHLMQKVDEEKKKVDESAKAYEDLQKEIKKHEGIAREGEGWQSKAAALGEKVRELEANLTQKASAAEQLAQQKNDLSKKIEGLERNVQEMTESLRSRDGVLAQFEKQIMELAGKAMGHESLRQEHAQLSQERATIRQEYDAKLDEREMRLAKAEEDHRRYRSRADRKNAAAARELGEWIRGLDNIRQGLQKLILFLGSESAVLESEKKSNLKSPLTRGPDAPSTENS